MKKPFRVGVVLLVLAAAAVLWRRAGPAPAERTDRFEPAPFARQRLDRWIEATGVVRPRNRLEVRPPLGGRVEEVLVVEGDTVVQGQILAWISSTERAILLDAARAQGAERLEQWMEVYRPTALVAPLEGTVIARRAEPGQTLGPGHAPIVLSDRLVVIGRIDETDIGRVRAGQSARVGLDAYPDVRVEGSVAHIAHEAVTVDNVIIYEVQVELEEIPDVMRSGMTATVHFLAEHSDEALTLPADAVEHRNGEPHVWVMPRGASRPVPRPVVLGLSADGRVEIRSGLEGTEEVVRRVFVLAPPEETRGSPFLPRRRRP